MSLKEGISVSKKESKANEKNSRIARRRRKRNIGGTAFTIFSSIAIALLIGVGLAYMMGDGRDEEETKAPAEKPVDEERKKMLEEAKEQGEQTEATSGETEDEQEEKRTESAEGAKKHTIKNGDTLYELSLRYYDSPKYQDFLAEYNQLDSPDDLKLGMVITVPETPQETSKKSVAQASLEPKKAPAQEKKEQKPAEEAVEEEDGRPQDYLETHAGDQIHTVKSGDNLYRISLQYYDTPEYQKEIAEYNGISVDGNLDLGQEIVIPPRPAYAQ